MNYVPPPVAMPEKRITEASVEQYLRKKIKEEGGIDRKWYARGNKGVHDRIVIFPNDEIWLIEVKAPDGTKTPHQKKFHKQLYEMAITRSITVWCKEDVNDWLHMRKHMARSGLNLSHQAYQPYGRELMIGRIKR